MHSIFFLFQLDYAKYPTQSNLEKISKSQDYLKAIHAETPGRPILCKYNDVDCGTWALYGMAFGKIIKTNQDILTFLKLKNHWKWINNVIKYPNRRHLYKAPRNQIFKKKKKWNPFKKITKFINVCKSQIENLLQNRDLF